MKRFTNLLKKEIKELVTKQLIFSLAFTIILFNFIGQVSRKEVQKAIGVQTISALDQDGSAASKALLKGLESARFKILDQSGKTKEQALETAKAGESKLLLVIPAGFGESLKDLKPSEIETYSFMRTFSLIGARGQIVVGGVISALNNVLSNNFLKDKLPEFDRRHKTDQKRDFVVAGTDGRGSAQGPGLISQQSCSFPSS
jgi:ABC-2 type transport system permease protein